MKNAIVTKAWINKTVQIYAEAGFVSAYIDIFYVGNFCRGIIFRGGWRGLRR